MKTPNFRPTTLLFILIVSALALASCDRLEDDIPLAFTATGAPGTPAPSPTTLPAADSSTTVSPSETPPAVAAAPTETPTVLFGAIVGGESPIVPPEIEERRVGKEGR